MSDLLFILVLFGVVLFLALLLAVWLCAQPDTKKLYGKRRFTIMPPLWVNPRGPVGWREVDWYMGERLNDTINAGKARAAKRHPRHKGHA